MDSFLTLKFSLEQRTSLKVTFPSTKCWQEAKVCPLANLQYGCLLDPRGHSQDHPGLLAALCEVFWKGLPNTQPAEGEMGLLIKNSLQGAWDHPTLLQQGPSPAQCDLQDCPKDAGK